MAIGDKIVSFWKQVRVKSSDMFTKFKVGIGVKVPTHKLHVKDAVDPMKLEGVQSDSASSTKFLVLDSDDVIKHTDAGGKTTEEVQDIVGAMFTSNTETRIAATYEDSDGTIDLVVDAIPVDLTVDGAGTVHTNNITDLHGAGVNGAANQLLTDDGDGTVTSESELTFGSDTLELGADDSTSVTIRRKDKSSSGSGGQLIFRSGSGTGTNINGGNLRFHGGFGTGSGDSGEIRFSVSSSVASGTTQHSDPITRILTLTDANATVAGNIVVTGTVDGRDVATDGSKLDGIEASADVTDTANVTAAGALMDSELTDLAGVKGVTISTLQVKPSEGAFANGDKTKLDGIAAGATADQTNVTGSSGSCTGNAATATALATARAINGVDFNGTAPITVTAAGSTLSDTVPVSKGGTGATALTSNAVLTGNGTSAITPEQTLSYDSETLTIGADDNGIASIHRLTHGDDSGGRLELKSGDATGTNKTGGTLLLAAGRGTGTGTGGNIIFYSHSAGSSGSAQGTATDIATINPSGDLQIDGDLTVDGNNITNNASAANLNIASSRILELQHAGSYDIQLGNSTNPDVLKVEGDAQEVTINGTLELGHATDTTIARSAAGKVSIEGDDIQTQGEKIGQYFQIKIKDLNSYMFYMYNDDSWYSAGSGTLAILGSSTAPASISSANSEYQSRTACYTAVAACTVKKLQLTFYWSSSVVSSADIDFAFSKFTPITDGTAASITMNAITATDHNGSYTENKPYQKTFTFSGGNASLSAGDALGFHMRTTGGSSGQRIFIYGTAILSVELD